MPLPFLFPELFQIWVIKSSATLHLLVVCGLHLIFMEVRYTNGYYNWHVTPGEPVPAHRLLFLPRRRIASRGVLCEY